MNKSITRFLSAVAILIFTAGLAPIFGQSEEQIERFKKEREVYFTKQLELTEKEAAAFWPLYDDFHNRKMKLIEDERNTYSYAQKNYENLSDDEIMETLSKVHKLKVEQLKLEEEYYQGKFLKALPPKKVLKLGKVEWDFRRHLMRELRGQGEHGRRDGRPGGGQRGGQDGSSGGQDGSGGGQGGSGGGQGGSGEGPYPMAPPPDHMF